MSLTKSAARRLSLMAGSSLVAASLSAAASLGTALAPTAVAAQVICTSTTSPVISGNGTNAVTLPAGTYNPGITCVYTGAAATVSTTGAVTVSTTAGGNGINLSATGTDSLTWDSTLGTTANDAQVTGGNFTNGPVIDATSASGNITIRADNVTGSANTGTAATNSTHAIRAASGSGDITIVAGAVTSGGTSGAAAPGVAAVEAISSGGGDVSIDVASANGRLYGIRAETTGAGNLTINGRLDTVGSNPGINVSAGGDANSAAIYAKTGTGLLRIDAGGVGSNGSAVANAVRIETGGDAILNFTRIWSKSARPVVDMTTTTGTLTTLTHSGVWGDNREWNVDFNDLTPSVILLRAEGGGDITINSNGAVGGRVDLSTATGNFIWNVNSVWTTGGTSSFGPGDALVTIGAGGQWLAGLTGTGNQVPGDPGAIESMMMDFGEGDDSVVNNGLMVVGPKSTTQFGRVGNRDNHEAELQLVGLETFENAGTIYFGSSALPGQALGLELEPRSYATGPDFTETDYTNDDVLLMPGTHWIGSGGRLVIDAFLDQSQSACDVSLRTPGTNLNGSLRGEMPAADCLGLQGGSTEGETRVLINQLATGDRGGSVRIVLVDVTGGTSEGGHFVLDPLNLGYNPDQGGYLDLGYLIMPLVYDADTQQHVLLGTAGQNAWQTAGWAAAAHDAWRVSTGSWLDRQADLRNDLPEGYGGGIWMRTSADFGDRKVAHAQQAGTSTFVFDNSYEQRTYAVTGGADLLAGGGANSAWALGLMAGYANSELAYDASPNTTQFDSWTGGLYASFLTSGLYLDAVVSGSRGDVKADMPELGLSPAGTLLDTNLVSVGAQVEGGWRIPLMESLFIEPLAGVSYVRTKWDEMTIASDDPLRPGIDVEFDDPTSLRANVGARLGLDQNYGGWRAQYSILGRLWNEFEGEHNVILHNTQDDILVGDAFTGQLSEFGVGVSLYGLGEALSAFGNFGGKFGDDYQSQNLAVGVRVNW